MSTSTSLLARSRVRVSSSVPDRPHVHAADCVHHDREPVRVHRADSTSDRQCAAECHAHQYIAAFETDTTPRLCQDYVVCDEHKHYESEAPTPSSDRQCTNQRVCSTYEYQSAPATATTDREAHLLRVSLVKSTNTSRRQRPPTVAAPRTRLARKASYVDHDAGHAATLTSDRMCTALHTCDTATHCSRHRRADLTMPAAPRSPSATWSPMCTRCAAHAHERPPVRARHHLQYRHALREHRPYPDVRCHLYSSHHVRSPRGVPVGVSDLHFHRQCTDTTVCNCHRVHQARGYHVHRPCVPISSSAIPSSSRVLRRPNTLTGSALQLSAKRTQFETRLRPDQRSRVRNIEPCPEQHFTRGPTETTDRACQQVTTRALDEWVHEWILLDRCRRCHACR